MSSRHADAGHLEIKRQRIAELEAENEALRDELMHLRNAQRPAPAAPGIIFIGSDGSEVDQGPPDAS